MITESTQPQSHECAQHQAGETKILIIEDDSFISQIVSTNLTKNCFAPTVTNNGNEVIPLVEKLLPRVIIMDLMVPGMTGEEILANLKQNEQLKHIPVIVFSNRSSDEDKKRLMELGATDYLVKVETDMSTLAQKVRELTHGQS